MTIARKAAQPGAQSGFTLIEILVAVLVLSVGILGLVGLESFSMQNNRTAHLRSQASILAYELADRIRANPGVDYSSLAPADNGCRSFSGTATSCTPQEIGSQDLFDWQQQVGRSLPIADITQLTVAEGDAGDICQSSDYYKITITMALTANEEQILPNATGTEMDEFVKEQDDAFSLCFRKPG